jgi:uncharacterized coiled-coil protein SlyX
MDKEPEIDVFDHPPELPALRRHLAYCAFCKAEVPEAQEATHWSVCPKHPANARITELEAKLADSQTVATLRGDLLAGKEEECETYRKGLAELTHKHQSAISARVAAERRTGELENMLRDTANSLRDADMIGYADAIDPDLRDGGKCKKHPHAPGKTGYMHDADDDGQYDVDGVLYCGRCHHCVPCDGGKEKSLDDRAKEARENHERHATEAMRKIRDGGKEKP